MMRQTCPCKEKKPVFSGFFGFSVKQHWPLFVAMNVLLLLVMTIPTLMFCASCGKDRTVEWGEFLSFAGGDAFASWFFLGLIAVVCGIVTVRFMNHKESVTFWHSVPMRRERLLANDMLLCFGYAFLAYFLNSLLSDMVFLGTAGQFLDAPQLAELAGHLLRYFGNGLLIFAVSYALMLLAAMLAGTDVMRVIMGAVLVFLPYALCLAFFGTLQQFADYTDWSSLITGTSFLYGTIPLLRLATAVGDPLAWYEVGATILYAAVLMLLSFLLYRRRKSEVAGQPLVHGAVATVLLYCGMFVSSVAFGFIMKSIGGSAWLLIGYAAGMVVSFMIINAVLSKSPKAMFRKPLRLLVFGVCFAAFLGLVVTDPFQCDRHALMEAANRVEISSTANDTLVYEGADARRVLDSFDELADLTEAYREAGRDDPADTDSWKQGYVKLSNGETLYVHRDEFENIVVTLRLRLPMNLEIEKRVWTSQTVFQQWVSGLDWAKGRNKLFETLLQEPTQSGGSLCVGSFEQSFTAEEAAILLRELSRATPADGVSDERVVGRLFFRTQDETYFVYLRPSDWPALTAAFPTISEKADNLIDLATASFGRIVVVDWEKNLYAEFGQEGELRQVIGTLESLYSVGTCTGRYVAYVLIEDQTDPDKGSLYMWDLEVADPGKLPEAEWQPFSEFDGVPTVSG